ncbi:MAG: hypothetical protein IIA41_15715 [SAR324 cluster bacterium]|nr:hypothetical protein [SAR324 cluster bacterium]
MPWLCVSIETVAADGTYLFSYLPAGDYTLAFSCNAFDDNPDFDDHILIPAPEEELIEDLQSVLNLIQVGVFPLMIKASSLWGSVAKQVSEEAAENMIRVTRPKKKIKAS